MARTRWDIRYRAKHLVGDKGYLSPDERANVLARLKELYPGVQISTLRCALGTVLGHNRNPRRKA